MSNKYDAIAAVVLDIEGGESNRPLTDDPGGHTKHGVPRKFHPEITDAEWATWSPADSYALFKRKYWDVCHCEEMSHPVATMVFDGAIQHGPDTALELLQKTISARPDGVWGPETKARLALFDSLWVAQNVLAERTFYYMGLDNWRANRRGWMIRLGRMYALAERLA